MSGDHDHPTKHSMVLFGDTAIYLMHMAAFESAHNDQVILEVRLSKSGADPESAYRSDRRTSGAAMHSIDPSPMVLSEVKAGSIFTGNMHRGNFEAEPDLLVGKVTVTVERIVHLTQLDPQTATDPAAGRRYLCFGTPGELFAVHEITTSPSFDQVIPVRIDARDSAVGDLAFPTATPLRLPGTDDEAGRLVSGEITDAHFPEAFPQAAAPGGERGVRTTIVAGDEIFFDSSFLQSA